MKKSNLLLVGFALITALILPGCDNNAVTKKLTFLPFNTATIKYELSGSFKGEETLYIKGDLSASHKYVTQGDQEESTLDLNLGSEKYLANLIKMTAAKVKNEEYDKLVKMTKEEQLKRYIRYALGLKDSDEIPSPAGTKKVAGETCDVYVIENVGTACLWNGLVLEKEISILGVENNKKAVSLEIDKEIPKDRFELPAGIILTN
jgi:hypothetical protein